VVEAEPGASAGDGAAVPDTAQTEARRDFYRLVEDFLNWLLEQEPTYATQLGVHAYDNRLADMSWERIAASVRRIEQFGRRLDGFAPGADTDWAVDLALMKALAGRWVRDLRDLDLAHRSPDLYLGEALFGPYLLLMKDFAPLPQRAADLAGRLGDVPAVLAAAQANLRNVPGVWVQIAHQTVGGALGLFQHLIPAVAAQLEATHPLLAAQVRTTNDQAITALHGFAHFLETHVQEAPDATFAVGTDIWNAKVREEQMLDLDADQIEAIGHKLIAATERDLAAEARRLDPGGARTWRAVLAEVRQQHPPRAGLLAAYRDAMAASRQFVIAHDLVTLPPGESLAIQETPAPIRPLFPFAAYMQPGPFEQQQQGVFCVTPVEPGLDPQEEETRLRGHPYAKIPIMAVHEGYPGHHVQLVWANQAETLPRRLGSTLSTLFIEGWAFYCEEMMEQEGFLADPRGRLMRLAEQLWRACRIVIDVGLHCRGMSFEAAVAMLVEVAGMEQPDAVAEVQRYTGSPTQPMSYLMGKREIMAIAAEYRARQGAAFQLKAFHDALLACGSLPPRLIRWQLFGRE
jgi:uncharacterized protein (DUF885 family)